MKSIVQILRISLLLISFYLFFVPTIQACTCSCDDNGRTLCSILSSDTDLLVLQGLVYDVRPNAIGANDFYVEVLDQINNLATPDSIKVVMKSTCNEPLNYFDGTNYRFAEPGDTVLMVVAAIPAEPDDEVAPYVRYSCSSPELFQVNGKVQGWLNAATRELPYNDFKTYVNSDLSQDLNCDVCDCVCQNGGFFAPETFCGTIRILTHWEYVIRGEVIAKEAAHGLKLRVDEVLSGAISESEITIWAQIGSECRSPSDTFEVGDSYVFVLSDIELDEVRVPAESTDDYQLGSCGVNYLKVVNGNVQGAVTALINEIDLPTLADWIDVAFDNVDDCLEIESSLTERDQTIEVDIFPNPTTGEITIQGPATQYQDAQVRVYTTLGQLIFSEPFMHTANGKLNLTEFIQQKGLYLLELKTSEGRVIKKILLQ